MKTFLVTLCLWHTTLIRKDRPPKEVDLINQPKIGTRVHINGLVWKVKDTHLVCNSEPEIKLHWGERK